MLTGNNILGLLTEGKQKKNSLFSSSLKNILTTAARKLYRSQKMYKTERELKISMRRKCHLTDNKTFQNLMGRGQKALHRNGRSNYCWL